MKIRYVCDAPLSEVTHRIVRNPAYPGEPTGHPKGYAAVPIAHDKTKPGFYVALGESIAKEGLRNPVILQQCPNGLYLQFGGSRILAARAVGVSTGKALVVDWTGRWADRPLVTPENVADFFTDVPQLVEFTDEGLEQHYHLERSRRNSYDEAGLAWVGGNPQWLRREFPWLKRSED